MPENGILATIPGEYIAKAMTALPDPENADDELSRTCVDIGPPWNFGRVQITFRRMKRKRDKSTYYFWTPAKATLVD